MIFLPLLALAGGFALFYFTGHGFEADEVFARYTAIAVLAGLDTVLGGVRARLTDDFDDVIFVTGFFANALLAGGLVLLGEKLGLETGYGDDRISAMMIAAVVVFGSRIFNNLAALRRLLIERWRSRKAEQRGDRGVRPNFGRICVALEDVVVGLDIGTTKVCTVVGHGDAQGRITIVGVGLAPSRGVKKGVVVDVDDTVAAIRDSVDRARHMAGIEIRSVVAGITGEHIQSSNRRGTVTIAGPGGVVTEEDVERVMHAAAMDVPRDREIVHSLPRDFSVDGHSGVRRPVGMCGQRLEVESHIVTGQAGFLQNVVQCVERAGLEVDALVLEPIATSEAVCTADERELGVALIDIGGGTSDIAVFLDGSIAFSAAIPVGGNHVTRDVSIGLRTPFEIAERLKVERGVASPSLIPHGEALEVISAGSGERLRLPRAILGEIIEARMSELFEMSRAAIETAGVQNRLAGGVILTGGGALLPGATELAQQIFDLPVRLGRPIELSGWSDKVDTPQFATGVGLLRFALRQPGTLGNPLATSSNPSLAPAMADPQRRVWSMHAQGANGSTPPVIAGTMPESTPENGRTLNEEISATNSEVAEQNETQDDSTTPFDRIERSRRIQKTDQPSLLQKLLAKIRDVLGFETV